MSVTSDEHEHEISISRAGLHPLVWLALLALVTVVGAVALLGAGDDSSSPAEPAQPVEPPTTPTSETLTTTQPPPPEVYAVADADGGPVPAVADRGHDIGSAFVDGGFEALQAPPIATAGRVVVLVDGGRLLAGTPGSAFEPALLGPVSAVVASSEPDHVWARVTEDELALVDLDGGEPTERIPVGTDRVLGPASSGVVTVTDGGDVLWRRPRVEPTPVPLPADRTPIDAGGEVVLAEAPDASGGRTLELYAVADGGVRQTFRLPAASGTPQVAPDGSHAIAPTLSHWTVREVRTGLDAGRLPLGGEPVWVGQRRFATVLDDGVAVSDGRVLRPSWRIRALAEASP